MRKCLRTIGSPHSQLWQCRTTRTRSLAPRRKPVVMQLSNTELLDIITESKGDSQPEKDDPKLENEDTQSQPLLDPQYGLPGSPLTDPRLLESRNRRKARKAPPRKEKSTFQSKLLKNPFGTYAPSAHFSKAHIHVAHALATPPRLCLLTNIRLPNHFLFPFGLQTHPKTGAPWHLPRLPAGPPSKPTSEDTSKPNDNTAPPSEASTTAASENPAPPEPKLTRSGMGTSYLAYQGVLRQISELPDSRYRSLMPYRWKQDPNCKVADIVWREDMDKFVLEILRENVARRLVYLASSTAAYISSCRDHEHISKHHQVCAVLWLGPNSEDTVGMGFLEKDGAATGDFGESGPPPYAMHHYKNHYIPVYNLLTLLGPTKLRYLRENKSSHFGKQYAVIKMRRLTLEVQLELWKLLGYLAPGESEDRQSNIVSENIEVE